ncbi:unnamed protein product [Closterium sp. NIES-65]|nr:unnamed protein product [Closterium sp. NIES-65]
MFALVEISSRAACRSRELRRSRTLKGQQEFPEPVPHLCCCSPQLSSLLTSDSCLLVSVIEYHSLSPIVQLPALSPSFSAAEEEDPRIEASWDSSEAAEESSEPAVGSFEAEEISYEAAGYSSETSEEFSGAADDFPVPAEASTEAPFELSNKDVRMECDRVSVGSIVASTISMVDSSCKTLLSSSFGNATRLYSSGDYVDYSKSFTFTVPWAAVTREAVSAGHRKLKKGNNGDLKREPNQVLKSAATTELAASKCMVSRMALASLKLLPTRIPKPGSARAPALKTLAAEERKVLLESVCSRIPKPRSARAPDVKTVAVEEKKVLHGFVCSEKGGGSEQQIRRRQERVDIVKSEGKKGNVRVTRVAAVRPPWRP